jgi:hypothetical protein
MTSFPGLSCRNVAGASRPYRVHGQDGRVPEFLHLGQTLFACGEGVRPLAQNPWNGAIEPTKSHGTTRAAVRAFRQVLLYHQHHGEPRVSIFVYIEIMESPETDIFTPFVFNNIARVEVQFFFADADAIVFD